MLYCLLFFFSFTLWSADDRTITLPTALDRAEDMELAETILNAFFQGNNESVRERLGVVLAQRVRAQGPEVRYALWETYEHSHGVPSIGEEASEEVSSKVFELLTDSIEGVIEEERDETDRWRMEAKQRCKKATVAGISAVLGLMGAAIGAAVAASIESARCNC